MPEARFGHAIVVGASMAGLLSVRALSDHFETVTLIERDTLPRRAEPRKGVPQGRHVHVLLGQGHAIIEGLFPAITKELYDEGALAVDLGRQLAWHHDDGWRARYDSGLYVIAASRPLLETLVSERVRAIANVRIIEGASVAAPATDNGAVAGVHVDGYAPDDAVTGDLVVDATGRGSALPRWLEELGHEPPEPDTIPAQVTYTTCQFRRAGTGPDWRALLVTGSGARRSAFTWAIEGDRWLVSLTSLFDEPAPRDIEGFLSFAGSIPVPDLHATIRDLEPITDLVRYRFPGSGRRRYERMGTFPPGLIAIGDAVSSFNPVYGQGMTVAALEAKALQEILGEAGDDGGLGSRFSLRWFQRVGRIVDPAWQAVSIEDYRLPELAARRPATLRPIQWYMGKVQRATHSSTAVADQFYRVLGMTESSATLFRPRMVAKVLSAARRG